MNKDDITVTTGELAKLFDTTPKTIATLGAKGVIVPAGKRGRWQLQPSVAGGYRGAGERSERQSEAAEREQAESWARGAAKFAERSARGKAASVLQARDLDLFLGFSSIVESCSV